MLTARIRPHEGTCVRSLCVSILRLFAVYVRNKVDAMAGHMTLSVQSQNADLAAWISDACNPLDLGVAVDPHGEKQDTKAPGGYRCDFVSET